MEVRVVADRDALADAAASLLTMRLLWKPELTMAVPAGRTPRRMYEVLRAWQTREPGDFSRMHVFSVDELCPPAPSDGYFWRQVRREFLDWAAVPARGCHPLRVDAPDLAAMCLAYEETIRRLGGLDLVMLGLGPNGHLASNEPGSPFDSLTRPVRLLPETVSYILTDDVTQGEVSESAVTLGLATIMTAREVVVLVSGAGKRQALRALLEAPVSPAVPASILRDHPRCTVLCDADARR